MLDLKATKIVSRTRRKNLGSFLAMSFCTLVVVSTIGNSFGVRNSFAQQELQTQTQPPSTISKSPWSNSLPVFNTGNMQTADSDFIRHHLGNKSITVGPNTLTNFKNLDLNHS